MSNETDVKIIRTPRSAKRPYFSMARSSAQDKRLSWEARGLLTYLLSKPDDWRVQIKDLMQGCGRDKVYAILRELREAKYLALYLVFNSKGQRVGSEYDLFEIPYTEKPDLDLPDLANTDSTYKRVLQSTEIASGNPDAVPPSRKKAKAKPQASQWLKKKKDAIFDAIARGSFGITVPGDMQAAWGGRIGKIIKGLQAFEKSGAGAEIDAGSIYLFFQWFRSNPDTADLTPPRDATKFMEYFMQFWGVRHLNGTVKPAQPLPAGSSTPESTPVDIAAKQAEARRKLEQL